MVSQNDNDKDVESSFSEDVEDDEDSFKLTEDDLAIERRDLEEDQPSTNKVRKNTQSIVVAYIFDTREII